MLPNEREVGWRKRRRGRDNESSGMKRRGEEWETVTGELIERNHSSEMSTREAAQAMAVST